MASVRGVEARAPGRLDVMGGIADYCGAVVLPMPLAVATTCSARPRPDSLLRVASGGRSAVEVDIAVLPDCATARDHFASRPEDAWAGYALGIVAVWREAFDFEPPCGVDLSIATNVPEAVGVSSSAALEVACASALAALWGVRREPTDLALDCQRVENLVVGAPCGVMDQMVAVHGRRNQLLRLHCQPAELEGFVVIPDSLEFWGIDSGIRHSVAGADYGTVRTAAFMGHRIMTSIRGEDPWQGYLANVEPKEFTRNFVEQLPERMPGHEFLERFESTIDPLSVVAADRDYPVRAATAHPVFEQARVERFAEQLVAEAMDPLELGRLMRESHDSYGACGLGSDGTDLIVSFADAARDTGVFGSKITGGGSGGSVALLCEKGSESVVRAIAQRYCAASGHEPVVFSGSSDGSLAYGLSEYHFPSK